MRPVVCPSSEQLEQLFLGDLPEAEVVELEEHVLRCKTCFVQLQTLLRAKDTLSDHLDEATLSGLQRRSPDLEKLVHQLESLWPTPGPNQGPSMIAFACSGCQKKLSTKPELAGKKVKCPGCGQISTVPRPIAVPAGKDETQAFQAGPASAPSLASAGKQPTNPPASKPDETLGSGKQGHDPLELTNLLSPPQAPDELGRLGKYRVLEILGHGGMGVVFKAEDPMLQRLVAIKAMLPTLAASASAGKRFLREARSMAAVVHDHIVRVYQVDEDRGVPFLAMEYLKGEPLDSYLAREPRLPTTEVLRMGREIAEGLSAAHEEKLIHRDIKPGNIWLEGPKKRVKILDFGLARAASKDAGLTQQGAIIGTPAYMAPEQARGAEVDARCDLFSLGVVLYRMCTGQQPFHGADTVSTLMAVAMHAPTAPAQITGEIPQGLSELVMKLLEKDVANRPANAEAVAEELRRLEAQWAHDQFHADTPVPARPATQVCDARAETMTQPGKSRGALQVALALGGFAALLVLGIVLFWQTKDGTVRIEINDPEIQVTLKDNQAILKGVDQKHEIKLELAEKGFKVTRGTDFSFETDKLILKKGATTTVHVKWLDGKIQVLQDGDVIKEASVPKKQEPALVATASKPRASLRFRGPGQYLDASALLPLAEPWTVEGWVMPTGAEVEDFFAHPLFATATWWIAIINKSSDAPRWQFGGAHMQRHGHSKQPVLFGKFQHIAVTHDEGLLTLFIDGEFQDRINVQLPKITDALSPGPTSYGASEDRPGFFGSIREVRISKAVLYRTNFTPSRTFDVEPSTLGLYHFDEGEGDFAQEFSGKSYPARIVGATWATESSTEIRSSIRYQGHGQFLEGGCEIPLAEPWTVEGWISPSSAKIDDTHGYGVFATSNWHIGIVHKSKEPPRWLMGGTKMTRYGASKQPVVFDKFQHLAITHEKGTVSMFLDGVLQDQISLELPANSEVCTPGPNQWLASEDRPGFFGSINEVRFSRGVRYRANFSPVRIFEIDATTISLYHFDEGGGVLARDSCGVGHPARIVGAKWSRSELPNDGGSKAAPERGVPKSFALEFKNENDFAVAPLPLLDQQLTLEAWVRAPATPSVLHAAPITWLHDAEAQLKGLTIDGATRWSFVVPDEKGNWYSAYSKKGITANRWYHLAGVFDGETVRLYVNGELNDTANFQGNRKLPGPNFRIGGAFYGAKVPFVGQVKSVRVSKIARYKVDFTPYSTMLPDANTVALYQLHQGHGDLLKDSSVNNHHGLIKAKWVTVESAIDLVKVLDLKKDRVHLEKLTGDNNWSLAARNLTYTTDGKVGKIVMPVDLSQARNYEISFDVRRLSGTGAFTLEIPTAPDKGVGLEFLIGGRVEMKAEKDERKQATWPTGTGDRGRVTVRIGSGDDNDYVAIAVNGQQIALWFCKLSKIGESLEGASEFPGAMRIGLLPRVDSFEFSDLKLRVFSGSVEMLRNE